MQSGTTEHDVSHAVSIAVRAVHGAGVQRAGNMAHGPPPVAPRPVGSSRREAPPSLASIQAATAAPRTTQPPSLTTLADAHDVKARLRTEIKAELKAEMRAEVRAELKNVRAELKNELRSEMEVETTFDTRIVRFAR